MISSSRSFGAAGRSSCDWQPVVTDALTAFAQAAGEIGEQDWWLGWSAHSGDLAEEDPPAEVDAAAV